MSRKAQLREQRIDTVINAKSKREDKQCQQVVLMVVDALKKEFKVDMAWEKRLTLADAINTLKKKYTTVSFANPLASSFMSPDGGIVFLLDKDGNKYPILISEVKNQGTNDIRAEEGKKKQAQGNAVERLGKNVIGFRTYMLGESIFPFVCFGDGCDFEEGSSILDRVVTIAMFGELNKDHTTNEGADGVFNRGSYYFRNKYWTADEMFIILHRVARKSVFYYFSKYGDERFVNYDKDQEKVYAAN